MRTALARNAALVLFLFCVALLRLSAQGGSLYAGGSVWDDYDESPAVWEEGILHVLLAPEDLYDGRVLALYGDGRLYAAGLAFDIYTDVSYPVIWVDGKAQELSLPDSDYNGEATGIVHDGAALACGYAVGSSGKKAPLSWKDGQCSLLPLAPGMESGMAQGIIALKGAVWIAGIQSDQSGLTRAAGYWKDSVWKKLPVSKGRAADVTSIRAEGSDVLIGGLAADDAGAISGIYWTVSASGSAKETLLPHPRDSGGNLTGVIRVKNDAWASGSYGKQNEGGEPVLWKNGKEQRLSLAGWADSGLASCVIADSSGSVAAGGFLEMDSLDDVEPAVWRGAKADSEILDMGDYSCGQVNALAYAPAGLVVEAAAPASPPASAQADGYKRKLSVPARSFAADSAGISIQATENGIEADNRGPGKGDGVALGAASEALADFTLECTVTSLDGPAAYGNGIIFRADENGQGLLFNVTNDGRIAFYLYGVKEDSYSPYSIMMAQSSSKVAFPAAKSGAPNALKVVARGSVIGLYVNGSLAGSVSVDLVGAGRFGLYVSAGNKAEFRDWKVSTP